MPGSPDLKKEPLMIYDDIRNFLGQQNFALTATANSQVTILRNCQDNTQIFCVVIHNSGAQYCGPSQIQSLNERLSSWNGTYNDVLFIVVTDNAERDKALSQLYRVRLWLADENTRQLLVYENQPEDFYGLRFGINETVAGEIYPEKGAQKSLKLYKTRLARRVDSLAYVTAVLIIANVVYFIACASTGSLSSTSHMLKMGANYGVYVFERAQVFRLFTAMFIHFSFSHLAGNMLYLGAAGYNLEKSLGHFKLFLIYMLSGLGANLISAAYYYFTDPGTISAGASGAVYGLIGATVFLTIKNRGKIRSKQLFLRIGIIIVFLYYSNFTQSGVDGAAHIAGFIFGLILCIILTGGRHERR